MASPSKPDRERIQALRSIRDATPGTTAAPQRTRLLTAIQQLGSVTTFEASRELDVYDPRARKMELVRAGHPIQKVWDHIETEAGVMHRVGRYFMVRDVAQEVGK